MFAVYESVIRAFAPGPDLLREPWGLNPVAPLHYLLVTFPRPQFFGAKTADERQKEMDGVVEECRAV